ncbi:MAG: trypsin-like peptidase domain-containing protein [Candidatus Heimdallarchaeota archaeon]|nr:trypsin-like peptidase domain-containing protein [Candidatus Heimdallarchaeota archaeon]
MLTYQVLNNNNKELGTAILIRDNLLLTSYHVVASTGLYFISHEKFSENEFLMGRVIKHDKTKDLALMAIEGDLTKLVSNAPPKININSCDLGLQISWLGYPLLPGERENKNLRLGMGYISSRMKNYSDKDLDVKIYEIDGSINSGHSGGPVYELEHGELIGVIMANVGSMNELSLINQEILNILQDVTPPLTIMIQQPNTSVMSGGAPMGWANLTLRDKEMLDKLLYRYNEMFKRYNLDIDVNKLKTSDVSFNFTPSMSQLLSLNALYELLANVLSGLQKSYQMGVGICVSGNEILQFLDQ